MEQRIPPPRTCPRPDLLSASFDKDGEIRRTSPRASCRCTTTKRRWASGRIKTQPGKFMLAGEGLCIGRDSAEPITDDYPGERPWRFTGGTIKRVAVDVSGEPFVDLEREAQAMLARE
jgi:arylsulfatase